MSESPPIGIGVVGAGMIAQRGILPHLSQPDIADRLTLQAVCDPVPDRADASAERFGIVSAYLTFEELLDDPNVEVVSIASPIGFHFEQAEAALQAGKHVHVNKTMTTTVAEADALIDLARTNDLRLVASPGEVLRPQLTAIRDLIAGGAIGTPSWAICGCALGTYHESDELAERESAPGGMPVDPSWYFRQPGGGPMYDMTAYALHQLTSVLGPAAKVTAASSRVVPEREFMGKAIPTEVDDNTIALLEFSGGMTAVVHGTAAGTVIDDFAAAIYFGTGGTISGLLLDGEPFEFEGRALTTDAPTWDWDAQMRVLPHVVGPHRELPESHVFEDIMQLVDLVRVGTTTPVTPEHARHVIEIIEASYRASESGHAQVLSTTFEFPPAVV
jgi:predicted dehydrogenase